MISDSRRNFVKGIGSLFASVAVAPTTAFSKISLPDKQIAQYDEAYWKMVKDQFTVKPGFIMMNAANLCPSPYQVYDAVNQLNHALERDVSFQHRSVFSALEDEVTLALADYLHVNQNEIAITRNTSESNNTIVNGLDLGIGDEVLLWEQNHPTNLHAWEQRAQRMGFEVKVISLPEVSENTDQIVNTFAEAVSDKTRLIAFSHISNVSGLRLPAAAICEFARSRDIMTLVDGAQSFGCVNVNLHEIGCDFYSGSAHKWLMGPKEIGVLYVRKNHIASLWPNIVAAGYEGIADEDIRRLSSFGQRHNAAMAGFKVILDFHQQIGKEAVEARVLALTQALREKISDKVNKVHWITPAEDAFRAGVLIFKLPELDERQVFAQLYESHHIACAPTGGIRLSPHIYNTMQDVDTVVNALEQLA